MTEKGELQLTIDQLTQQLNLLYSDESQKYQEIGQQISNFFISPASIPISFEIIRSSNDERLRFFAACSFRYFIFEDIKLFSQENLLEMANLFGSFIMNNQNRINSPDTKYVILSLADLCGIFTNLIDTSFKLFPPEIFLTLMGSLTCELKENKYNDKYNRDSHIEDAVSKYIDTIYQYFADTPFNILWAQSFSQLFAFFRLTKYCVPFLEKIALMTQDQLYFKSFIDFVEQAFQIDYFDEENKPQLFFHSNIAQLAINFLKANPNYASTIWSYIFDYSNSFLLSNDQIEFSEAVFQSFFDSLPLFFDDSEGFTAAVEKFTVLILTSDNEDYHIFYPAELRIKNIISLINALIILYNKNGNDKVSICIILSMNRLNNCPFRDHVKQFIASQQLSPAIFLMLSSLLFTDKDSELLLTVFNQIFEISDVPIESLHFIKAKLLSTEFIIPHIQKLIQFCLNILDKNPEVAIGTLKTLAVHHSTYIIPYSYDLSQSLLPIIPHFTLDQQRLLIQFFFHIFTPSDLDKLMTIQNQIIQTCSVAVLSQDLNRINGVLTKLLANLYANFNQGVKQFIVDFMAQLLPVVFHEFAPISSLPPLQDSLCQLIRNAGTEKCIVFPQIEDRGQKQNELINGGMYTEIFQWLFSMMNQDLCSSHFTVLTAFQIYPFPELLQIISRIGPNENSSIIQEMLDYLKIVFQENSDDLWPLIPSDFFISFFASGRSSVDSTLLKFFRDIHIKSNDVKLHLMEAFIARIALSNFEFSSSAQIEMIKTLAVLINGDKSLYESYVQMMASAFPIIDQNNKYFALLWEKANLSQDKIELLKNYQLLDICKELRNIIFNQQR